MSSSKGKKKGSVGFLQSVKFKVVSLTIVSMIVVTVAFGLILIKNVKKEMTTTISNYLFDLTYTSGQRLEQEIDAVGIDAALQVENLDVMFRDVGVEGINSSYAYIVSADGTMMYHPTPEKIGSPVENAVVTQIVSDIGNGKKIDPAVTSYLFKGAIKYAAYYVNPTSDFILVISADEADIYSSINKVRNTGIAIAAVVLVIASVVGYILASMIAAPINDVTEIVEKLADMDLTENEKQKKLNARKDETGVMSRAISKLHDKLADVIVGLKNQSEQLFTASDSLTSNASETATTVDQVNKAVNEISMGATSQADETQKATENVILMGNMVEDTTKEVQVMLTNADEMKASSDEATRTLSELETINAKAKEAIEVIYEQTNTTNVSAQKIREATMIITSIAEETNLLSLNASIEAARAGEQGRGFAVVASQISKLAEQSSESAQQIDAITNSLIADSTKAVETMSEVQDIMNRQRDSVSKTNEIFGQVRDGIETSIDSMQIIADKTRKMDDARVNVIDVVQNLTAIAEENAASTEETSASVTEVSNIVNQISDNAGRMRDVADELEQNMNVFKI